MRKRAERRSLRRRADRSRRADLQQMRTGPLERPLLIGAVRPDRRPLALHRRSSPPPSSAWCWRCRPPTRSQDFGGKLFVGKIVSLSLVRELAPVLMSLMVGGRVGAGMAAELGTMKVTEQIDALRALATNPVRKLVVPRVVACTLMFPLLTIVAIALGILGGLLIAVAQPQPQRELLPAQRRRGGEVQRSRLRHRQDFLLRLRRSR